SSKMGGGGMVYGVVMANRRRHTRFSRDWSSDVCSSDLGCRGTSARGWRSGRVRDPSGVLVVSGWRGQFTVCRRGCRELAHAVARSEERRVGGERVPGRCLVRGEQWCDMCLLTRFVYATT